MLKWLLTLAVVVIVAGLIMPRLARRRLPGDIAVRWRGRNFLFPFASALVFSLLAIAISRLL